MSNAGPIRLLTKVNPFLKDWWQNMQAHTFQKPVDKR